MSAPTTVNASTTMNTSTRVLASAAMARDRSESLASRWGACREMATTARWSRVVKVFQWRSIGSTMVAVSVIVSIAAWRMTAVVEEVAGLLA